MGGHKAWSMEKYTRQPICWRSATLEVGGKDHRTKDRWFKLLNIEQQNNEPQNDEVITSIFEIPYSIFYGSKRRQLR